MFTKPKIGPGVLLDFEGITCVGKGEITRRLFGDMLKLGIRCALEVEPSEGPIGAVIRRYIEGEEDISVYSAKSVLHLLFPESRENRDLVEGILSTVGRGEKISTLHLQMLYITDGLWHEMTVLSVRRDAGVHTIEDRRRLSTRAYGLAYGVPLETLWQWEGRILGRRRALAPDVTFYLRADPEESAKRLAKSQKVQDIHEKKLESIRKTAEAYERAIQFSRKQEERIVEVDANPPQDVVYKSVMTELEKIYGKKLKALR